MVVRLLVQFHPDVPQERWKPLVEQLDCSLEEAILPQRIAVVRCPPGKDPALLLAQFRQLVEVSHAEPNQQADLHNP
ncbi:MAG: hypothetical protein HYZ90_03955 [Candidatus Omnitrophica bacterium]|nr:hypothetical protein [Candidatus Omnitrophota bacterium]